MTIKELMGIRKVLPADSKGGSLQAKYKIAKFLKNTEADEQFFYSEMQKIIDECADKDENGKIKTDKDGNIPISKACTDTFSSRAKKLEETTVEDPKIYFTVDELEGFELSANDLLCIDSIIQS